MLWRFWSGHRDRLVLSLLGVMVLGIGLSITTLLTESITGTVTKTYEQTWRSPYDILVHIPITGGNLLPKISDPNVLTALPAGINTEQLRAIRNIEGVQVAAPLATVGYVDAGPTVSFPSQELPSPGPGLYRITAQVTAGQSQVPESYSSYILVAVPEGRSVPAWTPTDAIKLTNGVTGAAVTPPLPVLLVGIDPQSEAELMELNRSLIGGVYLDPLQTLTRDSLTYYYKDNKTETVTFPTLPVLIDQNAFAGMQVRITVDALDDQLHVGRQVNSLVWQGEQLTKVLNDSGKRLVPVLGMGGIPEYQLVDSPFPEHWPVAVTVLPTTVDSPLFPTQPAGPYRHEPIINLGPSFRPWNSTKGLIAYRIQGTFDATRLAISNSSGLVLPTVTYQHAEARHVLDATSRPINPPRGVTGGLSPKGFLLSPPALVTNIPSALQVVGENGISAIRVKVKDSDHFTPEAVARVRQVARQIEARTGLVAEVTMGSSPINVLIRVPATGGHADYGWVEQNWIHKDAAVTSVRQAEFGYGTYLELVMIVAGLYAVATGLAGVSARKRQVGLVAVLGWPSWKIAQTAMTEQVVLALLAAVVASFAAAVEGAPPATVARTLLLGVLLYLPAILATGYTAARVVPGDAIKWGDTAPGRRVLPGVGILPLALSSLMGRPGRTVLTVVATALPTALLLVLLFISRHLDGVLYTTAVGQYAALKVGPIQYAVGILALGIAAVTAFDLIQQNAIDHRSERALLYALGWPRFRIVLTMVAEGATLGFLAGVAGTLVGIAILTVLYGMVSLTVWSDAVLACSLSLVLGLVTGLAGGAAELRSWNRSSLAGLGARQVLRFRLSTLVGAASFLLILVGGTLHYVVPQLLAQQKQTTVASTAARPSASLNEGLKMIEATVKAQNEALAMNDARRYLDTLDPQAASYVMEQRHWLEDLNTWHKARPGATITRKILASSFLGETTARVYIEQTVPGQESGTLRTIWVKTIDNRWLEHGLDHEIYSGAAAEIWYPNVAPYDQIETLETTIGQAQVLLKERLSWELPRTPIFEVAVDEGYLRASVGPRLATQRLQNWTEYGEPVRIPLDGPGWALNHVTRWLSYQIIMERSSNHAAEWWREGVTRYALQRTGQHDISDALLHFGGRSPLSLEQLPTLHGVDLPDSSSEDVGRTAWLLAAYLDAQFGDHTIDSILQKLGEQPPDPRMTGPETYAVRDKVTIAAIETVTGRSLAELNAGLQSWFRAKVSSAGPTAANDGR